MADVSQISKLLGELSGAPGFEDGVKAVRDARPAPAAPLPPTPTTDPFKVDTLMKEGSAQERQQLIDQNPSAAYPNESPDQDSKIAQEYGSLDLPGWSRRLEDLGKEVKPKKNAGGLLGFLDEVKDIAGQPLGAALKAMDAPAEGVERIIGMAYWNEVPLSERWEMARWTYDSMYADVLNGGHGGRDEAIQDLKAGMSWDEIDEKYGNELVNTIGHMVLDPMWLVGGVPLVGKLPVPGAKAIGAGLNFAKIPGLRAVPVLNKIGHPVADQKLIEDLGKLSDLGQASEKFSVGRTTGFIRQLWGKTPEAQVDDAYTHITNITGALTDAGMWETGAVRTMFQDLSRGQLTRRNSFGLEGSTPMKSIRRLFEANQNLGKSIDRFESLRPMSANAFWDDAVHVLKTTAADGSETTIPELVRRGAALTPDQFNRYGAYRSIKFHAEFAEKGIPALYDVYGGARSVILAKADALAGAMKTALSMFTINTPSFVVMNWANNASSLITKLDDPAGLASFLHLGITAGRHRMLNELGFGEDLVRSHTGTAGFFKEMTGGTEDLFKGQSLARRVVDAALPFVRMADRVDQGARVTGTERGILDASAAVWHSGDGGVMPVFTEAHRSVPGLTDAIEGMKFRSLGDLAELDSRLAFGISDESITAEGLLASHSTGTRMFPGNQSPTRATETAAAMRTAAEGEAQAVNQGRAAAQTAAQAATREATEAAIAADPEVQRLQKIFEGARANYDEAWKGRTRGNMNTEQAEMGVHEARGRLDQAQAAARRVLRADAPAAPSTTHADELITAEGVLSTWAKSIAPDRFAESTADMTELARYLETSFPDHPLSQLNDLIDNTRRLRRSGDPDYFAGFDDTIDDWADNVRLDVFDRNMEAGLAPAPLPYTSARVQNVSWMDQHEFTRQNAVRQQLYTRIVAGNRDAFGGEAAARTVQNAVRTAMQDYNTTVRDLMQNTPRALNKGDVQRLYADMGRALEHRNRQIAAQLDNVPSAKKTWQNASRVEREHFNGTRDARLAMIDQLASTGTDDAVRRTYWAQHLESAHKAEADALERTWRRVGLEYAPSTTANAGMPIAAQGFEAMSKDVLDFLDFVKTDLPNRFHRASILSGEQLTAARELISQTGDAMRQRNLVATIHGRTLRDMTMLNYSQKRGFDGPLSLIFPYHFWIGRTAADWVRLTAARPGQTASLAIAFRGIKEVNDSADLPDRLKRNIRIPIPFFDEIATGPAAMYFDPLRVIYPLAGFQKLSEDGGPNQDGTSRAGQMFDFASNLGVGINPFMTLGLGATGILGDRDAYLRRGLASASSLPFGVPGPRVIRSAADWLAGISEDPDPEYLTPEIKEALANGEPLPENVLKEALQMATDEEFNGYRTDRMVANLVGADPERWSARDGLEALRYHKGPLWTEAEKLAKGEKGLRVITGWLFMPMQVYPEGEKVQRGLDAIWREVRDGDDPKQINEFFKQHPEYNIRRISKLDRNDPTRQVAELDTALFYLDLDKVEQKFGQPIDLIRQNIRRMEEAGYLETKEGRRLRDVARNDVSQLTELRQAELDQLDALYPHRSKELTLRAAPHERAMYQLREQYYSIRRDAFKTDEEFYAAREAFMDRIPVDGADPGEWMQAAVRSAAIWNKASEDYGSRPALSGDITAQRDKHLRQLTEDNMGRVSREDFQRYLSQNGTPPTPNLIEYQKASTEKDQYFAIAEAPGLTAQTVKAYQKQFWQAHPLLTKYYGRDEPKAWNAQSAYTYGRMDAIWKGYYAIENDARGARDYLGMNLEELNDLRRGVGLFPLRLLDFKALEAGVFGRAPNPSEVLK